VKAYVVEAPWVDDDHHVPQGLAGASAYIITPAGALAAIRLVERFSGWPNDALLCRQLLPGMLGVTTTYHTRVSGTPSRLA